MNQTSPEIKFVKVFDERIAIDLINGGFSFMRESTSSNETVYVFELTKDLEAKLCEYMVFSANDNGDAGETPVAVEDDTMCF